MSTKALVYPNGFEFMEVLPSPAGDRPFTFPLASGMFNFWGRCTATVEMSLTVSGITFGTTIGEGQRFTEIAEQIVPLEPRKLIDGIGKDYRLDFASPLDAVAAVVPDTPTPIGSDLTYGGVSLVFSGLFYFNRTQGQPVIELTGGIVASDTGWAYQWSITDPGVANSSSGNYLSLDGTPIPCWLSWSGPGVIAPTDGLITITTTSTFIWPS